MKHEDQPTPKPKRPAANAGDPRNLGKHLRLFGGASILAAMTTFLVQRWGIEGDWIRYMVLLGVTTALACAAFVGGLRFGEGRGARTLLGIVLTSIPIHFAITGGLLYSRYAMDDLGVTFEGATRWVANTPLEAWLPSLLTLLLIAPITFLGTRVMFRAAAGRIAVTILASALLIWVPIRNPFAVTALALASFALAWWAEQGAIATGALGRTLEARWMRALLFTPGALLFARQLVVYGAHYAMLGAVCAGIAVALLYGGARLSGRTESHRTLGMFFETSSLFPLAGAWLCLSYALYDHAKMIAEHIPGIAALGIFICACMISYHRKRSWLFVLGLGTAIAALGLLISGALVGGFWISLSAIAIGTIAASAGYLSRQHILTVLGASMVLPALVLHFLATIEDGSLLGWGGLVAAGFGAIVAAAAVEKVFASFTKPEVAV